MEFLLILRHICNRFKISKVISLMFLLKQDNWQSKKELMLKLWEKVLWNKIELYGFKDRLFFSWLFSNIQVFCISILNFQLSISSKTWRLSKMQEMESLTLSFLEFSMLMNGDTWFRDTPKKMKWRSKKRRKKSPLRKLSQYLLWSL